MRGSTGRMASVFIQDSTSTVGAGKTGLTSASAGLIIAVRRELSSSYSVYSGGNILAVTTVGTWLDPGAGKVRFGPEDATNAPGVYHLQFVDSLFGTSDASRYLVGFVQVTGGAPVPFRVDLEAVNRQDTVRLGLTALPNVASGSDGSVMLQGATQDVTLKSLAISNSAGPGITVTTTNVGDAAVRVFGTGQGILASCSETDGIAIYGKATASTGGIGILGAGGTGASAAGVKGTVGSGGGAPWAGLWEMLTSSTAFATAGSIGKRIVDNLDAAISSITITAAAIWTYASRTLTQTATQAATAAVSGNAISIRRGDSLSLTITGLGTLTGYSKIWFTVKRRSSDADSEAVLQIEQSVGLVYINGAAGTAANGAITVNDATTGSITITLQEAAADDLPALTGGVWDVQSLISSTVTTHATGSITIAADVTRAVS